MSARLVEIQRQVAAVRRRLEELGGRVGALRARVAAAGNEGHPGQQGGDVAPSGRPLFQGLGVGGGALDDVELTFEVLDTEDPGRDR